MAAKETMTAKVMRTLRQYQMLPPKTAVLVGVSGGADSTALLHWLALHAQQLDISVVAAHVNHELRGAEADSDEAFVRDLCAKLGIPLHILHADVRGEAQKTGEGLEECGRRLRYAFFYKICRQYAGSRIATAHTLSDNAETMLLNLARGAGAKGLAGIPPVRENVVRPLISVTRAETEQYCREHGLLYHTDRTNADVRYMRNWVRLKIVPQFHRIDPNFEEAAGRAACALREDDECLRELAQQALRTAECLGGWRAGVLAQQPAAVRMRALYSAARSAGTGRLSRQHLQMLDHLLAKGGGCTLPGGCSARVERGILLFPEPAEGYAVPLQMPQTSLPNGRILCIQTIPKEKIPKEIRKCVFSNCLDYDTITSDTMVRSRRAGDSFSPAGRGVTKSLKKLLNEKKIPPSLRQGLVILSNGQNILWIEGCGPSEQAKVTPRTRCAAVVTIKECIGNGKSDAR